MGSIDALAKAINAFTGGVVIVSHDFRLISQVAQQLWEVKDKKVRVDALVQFACSSADFSLGADYRSEQTGRRHRQVQERSDPGEAGRD